MYPLIATFVCLALQFHYLDPQMVELPPSYCDWYHAGYFAGACPYANTCKVIPPICFLGQDPSESNARARGVRDGEYDRIHGTILKRN